MSKVHIVNIHTTDCSGMKNYYYIGKSKKGNPLSNPFTYDPNHNSAKNLTFKSREKCIEAYRQYFKACYNKTGQESLTRTQMILTVLSLPMNYARKPSVNR